MGTSRSSGWCFAADFLNVLLDLVHDVWRSSRRRLGLGDFRLGLPGLGHEGRLSTCCLFASVKPAAITVIFTDSFMASSMHGAENDVGVFVRGLLDDGGGFVDFVQREAGGCR